MKTQILESLYYSEPSLLSSEGMSGNVSKINVSFNVFKGSKNKNI